MTQTNYWNHRYAKYKKASKTNENRKKKQSKEHGHSRLIRCITNKMSNLQQEKKKKMSIDSIQAHHLLSACLFQIENEFTITISLTTKLFQNRLSYFIFFLSPLATLAY